MVPDDYDVERDIRSYEDEAARRAREARPVMPNEPMKFRLPDQVASDDGSSPGPVRSGPDRGAVDAVRSAARTRLARRAGEVGAVPGEGSQPSRESASPQARKGTTVARKTLDDYRNRGAQMFERYRRELGIRASVEDVSPVDFVNWLLSRKPSLESSTWRMYRQCAMHLIEGIPDSDTDDAIAMLEADAIDRSRKPAARPAEAGAPKAGGKAERRTSALKEKRFVLEDYERMQLYLRSFARSKLAPVVSDWLRAGILTGLRPVEWRATDLEVVDDPLAAYGRRAWLYVLNANATNSRGNGVVRTLDLSAFPDDDLDAVRRMVERAREWLETDRFAEIQGQCSSLLYGAGEKIWPARRYSYSLYSCRHQAIANWKATFRHEDAEAEIAALSGHGVTATQGEHYGKRRSSWPPDRVPAPPRAVPEELAMVRRQHRHFHNRVELEIGAGLRKAGDVPEFPVG